MVEQNVYSLDGAEPEKELVEARDYLETFFHPFSRNLRHKLDTLCNAANKTLLYKHRSERDAAKVEELTELLSQETEAANNYCAAADDLWKENNTLRSRIDTLEKKVAEDKIQLEYLLAHHQITESGIGLAKMALIMGDTPRLKVVLEDVSEKIDGALEKYRNARKVPMV